MLRWLCIASALGGCHIVFSLEEVEPVALSVNGTFRYRTVVNDANHEPLPVEEILPATDIDLAAFLDDGSQVDITYRDDGTFTFPIAYPGQRYRIVADVGDMHGEWQHTAAQPTLGIQTAGRRNRRPAVQTFVRFNYPTVGVLPAHIASTGLYTITNTRAFGPTVDFDWRLATPSGGSLGLLDASEHDLLYALQYEQVLDTPTAWNRITGVSQMAVTQATGTVAMLSQPAAVQPNSCVKLVTNGDAERMRIEVAHQRGYRRSTGDWIAYSVPAPTHVGIVGVGYGAIASYETARDLDITRAFHDPYAGATRVMEVGVLQWFLTQLGSANSVDMVNSTRAYVLAEHGDGTCTDVAPTLVEPDVGIPGRFKLDGVELDFDNQEVTIDPARPATLTWSTVADGAVDTSTITLHELEAINNQTTLIPKPGALVHGMTALLDTAQLEDGRTYAVQVTNSRGRRSAGTGDFLTIEMPIYTSTIWTHTFRVRRL